MYAFKVKEMSIKSEISNINNIYELEFRKEYLIHVKDTIFLQTKGERDISEVMKMILTMLGSILVSVFTWLGVEKINNDIISIMAKSIVIFLFIAIMAYYVFDIIADGINNSIIEKKKVFITKYYCDLYIKLIDKRILEIK